jgi:hypothetical protein
MRRRQFTQTLALLAGGFTASAFAGMSAPHGLLRTFQFEDGFSRDLFLSQIGSMFRLANEPHGLVLKGIEDAGFNCPCEQFSLVFEPTAGARLEEGIHTLECPDGSHVDLYLIPSERGSTNRQLVSVFNLIPIA